MHARRTIAVLAAAAAAALALAGCSSAAPEDTGSDAAAGEGFPITIEHAFGETEIPAAPERVATWGWGSTEAALSLGVVPVAIAQQEYGANEDGVLPWVADELEELGAETPIILTDDGEAPPYEELVEAAPDVILAPYSGITEEQYELLSEIAPTVAYPDEAWTTPWRETVTIVGTALGLADEAQAVLDDLDAQLAAQAEAHPELAGKTVAAVWDVAGTFYVYTPEDSRVEFLSALGLEDAPAVAELANGDSPFYYTLSYEQLDQLESDLVISYHDTQEEADAFLASAPIQAIPAVSRGQVAQVVGTELIAAVSPPTALSLTYGLDELVASLSTAAQAG
ncbi:iron-siderophore ABC transporter substrate-binding protein [Agromyces mariniharenae]|uniref:Iron-siderophore ABC transporter substrate-binding protein n=1 Tax=Agromyces mariniharenae TaxID=2604423 RepID=A0A5S4V782_9MICO|nr:iron-siderophore ABC transporter substrate-binding protein [Agromyces mariniharenae]TYL52440.1 iron-siderophore ABC transporter substrate-binding protein [Agromyces mariniharenae]